ncbi:MAG: hypothetical protein AB7N76_06050 [Planctomycetota bacterium]
MGVLLAGLLPLAADGCATGTTALWRAGASRVGHEGAELSAPRPADQVEVRLKAQFGLLEETRSRRHFACATTTVLRKAFLLEEGAPVGRPERRYEVLADLTTEEFPRDEERSKLAGESFSRTFGVGKDAFDLFEVQLDPAWREAAFERLREYAGQLGADAVIEVYATGELEHHMWEGSAISMDSRSTSSPIHAAGKLLDPRLRDVRLHGRAVRYAR